MKLLYTGSVKNIYQDDDGVHLWFEYTDDYSVFDWGKMPDPIPGKGENLARLGEWFFNTISDPDQWAQHGLADHPDVSPYLPIHHHLVERQGNKLKVRQVDVPKIEPDKIGGTLVYGYDYPPTKNQLIPLEVIFRFGVPAGSSLLERKDWYPFDIYEGAEFHQPLVEFSTKLESKDRMLSYQEASLIMGGDPKKLQRLWGATQALALFLRAVFAARGLKLWDGKFEWAMMDGELTLVDSIGPDELRVGAGDAVFSKQFLRNYYLGSEWANAVDQGKKMAKDRGSADWKTIVEKELHATPGPIATPYLEAAEALYNDFYSIVVDGQASTRFSDALGKL